MLQQQTNEFDAALIEKKEDAGTSSKKDKQKRKRAAADGELAQDVDFFQLHVQNLLFLDQKVSQLGSNSQKSLDRIQDGHESQRKKRSKLRKKGDSGIGNSRSSSSRNSKQKHGATFDKKKAEAAKQKKTMEDIAKMLKKSSKKKK